MKKVIFVLITAAFLLCGCGKTEVCEEGEFWKITQATNGSKTTYDYIIYDDDGNILLEKESKTKPRITLAEYSNICIHIGDSAEYTVQYVCPYTGSISEVFKNPVAWGSRYVAVIGKSEEGVPVIAIRSSQGSSLREYKLPLSNEMTPEEAIIGAAFDRYDDHLTVIYVSENNYRCTAVLPVKLLDWENNPIDRFYDKYTIEAFSTPEEAAAAACERDIWKAEFDNAYQMLRGMANPKFPSLQDDIDDSAEAFEQYVKVYADLYMAYEWSSAYHNDGTEWADDIFYGTGASGAAFACEAELYRQATLDLYRMMNDRFESVDEAFIFDEQEYLDYLRNEAYLNVIENE